MFIKAMNYHKLGLLDFYWKIRYDSIDSSDSLLV